MEKWKFLHKDFKNITCIKAIQNTSAKDRYSAWGDGVVRQLSEYIRTQDPTSRGWSYRTLYKIVQLYGTYSRSEFVELVSHMKVSDFARPQLTASARAEIVPIEMAQMASSEIVPIERTVKWYLDNEQWLDNVTSGEYEKYYDNMYKNR